MSRSFVDYQWIGFGMWNEIPSEPTEQAVTIHFSCEFAKRFVLSWKVEVWT